MAVRLETSFRNFGNTLFDVEIHDDEASGYSVKNGYLYPSHAKYASASFVKTGWRIATYSDWDDLVQYLGDTALDNSLTAGGKLKDTDLTFWDSPNSGASNEVGFNARGSGYMTVDMAFLYLKQRCRFFEFTSNYYIDIFYNNTTINITNFSDPGEYACPIRLVKDSTSLTHGQSGTYTCNNGKEQRTICINGVEWLADNLVETKFNTGALIPVVTTSAEYISSYIAGTWCVIAYDNNPINVEVDATPVHYVAANQGFNLSYESDDVICAPILASQCSVHMYIQDSNRTEINQLIEDIANSGNENRFTVVIYANDILFWRGKLQAERTSIPDQYTAEITLQANDGFGRLKSIPYDNAGTLYEGFEIITKHIFNILNKLDMFTYGGIDETFAIITNWNHNSETSRLIENLQFHHDSVKEIKTDGTILPLTCYDVLIQILTRFNLRIVQQGGIFYFQNLNYLGVTGNKTYYTYDTTGAFIDELEASFNTAIVQKLAGGGSYFREPAKSVTSGYMYRDSLAGNNLFTGMLQYDTTTSLGIIPAGNGEVFGINLVYRLKHVGDPASLLTYFIEHVFLIQSGTFYLTNETGTMEWTTDSAARVRINGAFEIEDAYNFQLNDAISFLSAELADAGEVTLRWTWRQVDSAGDPVTPDGTDTVTLTQSIATIIYGAGEENEGTIVTIATGGNLSGEVIELPELRIGDKPYLRSIGRIQYYDSGETDWLNTESNWGYGSDENLSIMELTVREIMALQRTAVRVNTYNILQSYPGAANKINDCIVTMAEYSANSNQWRIDCFVPVINRDGITFTEYLE